MTLKCTSSCFCVEKKNIQRNLASRSLKKKGWMWFIWGRSHLSRLLACTVSWSSWVTPHRSPLLSSSRAGPPNARLLSLRSPPNSGGGPRQLQESRGRKVESALKHTWTSGNLNASPVRVVEQVQLLQSSQMTEPAVVEDSQLVVRQIQLLQAPQRVQRWWMDGG